MIPIWDRKGEVVAFGARILDGAAAASAGSFEEAKYINSAESLVFKKRETLYGAHLARDAARAAGEVVVVEGYLDAIALHAAGVANAVACLGTALTQTQLLAAAALSPAGRVVLNLDGDEAGANAVSRLASQDVLTAAAAAGADVRVATMPDGVKDPDEALRAMGVDEYVAGVIKPAVGWVEWLAAKELAAYEASGADGAAFGRCAAALQGLVAKAPTAAARAHHARRLARALADASGGGDAAFAARVEAELLAPAPRRPPPPSRPGAAPADAPAAPQEADGPASALVAAAGGAVPLSDLFVWTSAGGGGALPALHWMNSTCGRLPSRPATLAELSALPPCPICAQAAHQQRAADLHRDHVRPPARYAALPDGGRARAELLLLHALLNEPQLRYHVDQRLRPPPVAAADGVEAAIKAELEGGEGGTGDEGLGKLALGTPARRWLLQQLAADVAGEAPAEELWASWRELESVAPATWSELAELRAPSDALLADASAWAADPRAARRDAEMEILEREMRGGNAWASRDADAAAPEPAEAGRRGRGGGARRRDAAAAALHRRHRPRRAPPAPRRRAEGARPRRRARRDAARRRGGARPRRGLQRDRRRARGRGGGAAAGGGRGRGVGDGGHRREGARHAGQCVMRSLKL